MEIDGPITWDMAAAAQPSGARVLFRCPAALDPKALDGISMDTTPGACTRYARGPLGRVCVAHSLPAGLKCRA